MMEKLYRKLPNGRYELDSYGFNQTLSDGIWIVQTTPSSRSTTSLLWKVGDLKRPVDVITHASLQALESKLATYLVKLTEEGSEELEDAKKILGGYSNGNIGYYGCSASDLCSLLLRRIAIELEEK